MVVLTTSAAERDLALAQENHANCFLTKPVDSPRLLQLLAELGFNGAPGR